MCIQFQRILVDLTAFVTLLLLLYYLAKKSLLSKLCDFVKM